MLVVLAGVFVGTTGTASASSDSWIGENVPHSSCVVNANRVPGEGQVVDWWQAVINWANPFNDVGSPNPASIYFTLQCVWSPLFASYLDNEPTRIIGMSIAFRYGTGSEVLRCKGDTVNGRDWYPIVNGDQVRLGCTPFQNPVSGLPANLTGAQVNSWLSATNNFACVAGIQIHFDGGFVVRNYVHGGVNTIGFSSAVTHYHHQALSGGVFPVGSCESAGFFQGGVIPPDWPVDGVPEWAATNGCNGLTVRSEDQRGEFFDPGDPVSMWLAPIDSSRPPGAVDVRIQSVEARPRGEPVRWEETAVWPSSPAFEFEVGADTDQFNWAFLLTCSDGTSKWVYYDPSGAGAIRRVDDTGIDSPGLQECLDAAAALELAPSSWVPGLVDRLQCVAKWAVTPSRPMSWHTARLQSTMEDTGVGDVVQVATAAPRTMGSLASSHTAPTTISFGERTVVLPAIPSTTADRIRLGLGVLVTLWAIRQAFRWWSGATNSKIEPEQGGR